MKIGLLLVCTGPNYWPYAKDLIETARTNFLPGKDVDYLLWSDMPEKIDSSFDQPIGDAYFELRKRNATTDAEMTALVTQEVPGHIIKAKEAVDFVNQRDDIYLIATEHTSWPYPTLMRYHLFLREEELLNKYDYLFYCDVDMLFVGKVGDEILGPDLTAAVFPMFNTHSAGRYAPVDPNPISTAYIPQDEFWASGKQYCAGGLQGGTKESFILAMKTMKKNIDKDLNNNYIARWNDESHWNRYIFDNPPSVVLDHSYVYPDSMIEEYYNKIWGRTYEPKLVTLTKKITISKAAFQETKEIMKGL